MGNNRADAEKALQEQYDWIVFDGEYSALSLLASIGFDILTDNSVQLTEQTALNDAQQLGIDFAQESLNHGFNPATDVIYGGTMTFQNWFDPSTDTGINISGVFGGSVIPLPNKFVPFLAVKRAQNPPASVPVPTVTVNLIYPVYQGTTIKITNSTSIPLYLVLTVITEKKPLVQNGDVWLPNYLAPIGDNGLINAGQARRWELDPDIYGEILSGFIGQDHYAAIGLSAYKTPSQSPNDGVLQLGLERSFFDFSMNNYLKIPAGATSTNPETPGGPFGFFLTYGINIT